MQNEPEIENAGVKSYFTAVEAEQAMRQELPDKLACAETKYKWCSGALVMCGIIFFLMVIGQHWVPKADKTPDLPQTTQWIGKLSAGDGDKGIFTAPNVEIGLRSDGALAWRYVGAPRNIISPGPQPAPGFSAERDMP